MSDALTLDPELEGLLREVAADPRSTLLRVPRRPVPAGVFDHDPRVTAMAAGLTSAERHLLQAHRAELALLLRQGAVMVLTSDPVARLALDEYADQSGPIEVPEPEQWTSSVARAARAAAESEPLEPLAVLASSVSGTRPVRALELTVASLRVWPMDVSRVDLGLASYFEGDYRSAIRICRSVLSAACSPIIECCTLANLALPLAALGQLGDAMLACKAATQVDTWVLETRLNYLLNAIRCADAVELRRAAALVDEDVEPTSSTLALFCKQISAQKNQGVWRLDRQAIPLDAFPFGESSRKVAHAAHS